MVFFTDTLEPFYEPNNPHRVSPIPVTLKNNTQGYILGEDKRALIESKGVSVEIISRDDLKIDEI